MTQKAQHNSHRIFPSDTSAVTRALGGDYTSWMQDIPASNLRTRVALTILHSGAEKFRVLSARKIPHSENLHGSVAAGCAAVVARCSVASLGGCVVMHGLSNTAFAGATETDRPSVRSTDHLVGDVLADIASTLWPTNTAANIASEVGCTVRAAERYLGGQRDWSGDAIAAIVAEILKRHGMRNFKIAKKT